MCVFGKGWVYQDEATETGDAGGAEGAAAGDGGAQSELAPGGGEGDGAAGGAAVSAPPKKEAEAPDMKAAIDAALGYGKQPADQGKPQGKEGMVAPGATMEKHPNGAPKKNEKGEDLDPEGKVVQKQAPRAKTAAELDLKPEEIKALGPKAQQRFREVIGTLKSHESTIGTLTAQNKTLAEARDAILSVMEETGTTQEQLAGYLEFNALLQSKNPKDIETALNMVEQQRAALYRALGREPQGGDIDLLKDFPDLAKQVEDSEITRAAALEIASGRRERAAREEAAQRQQQQQNQQTQSAQERKAAAEKALKDVEAWTTETAKSDLDYKAKEDKLLAQWDEVLKEYPPHLWLTTLKRLYSGIEIPKALPGGGKQNQPLRPSGAKPGAKAPANMLEAINAGLGYGEKG